MADKVIVYSKQTGEPSVPVTARIEWLPDGQIKPLIYWMPDGSRFDVKHMYERTPNAFLKDRGVGIRFKVKAELTKTAEWDDELLHALYETYLYFVDERFCGKTFIDGRYGHNGKEFIPVTLDVFPNGEYELVCFRVQGALYMVEKTVAIEPRGNFNAGGIGIRHKVDVRIVNAENDEDYAPKESARRMASVYFEVNKWFVANLFDREYKYPAIQ